MMRKLGLKKIQDSAQRLMDDALRSLIHAKSMTTEDIY